MSKLSQYNTLWCLAYEYASNTSMTLHRVEQFAADYARTYEHKPARQRQTPVGFVAIAAACDFHYHG